MIPDFKTFIGESVWNDIRRQSAGIQERIEDKHPIYFRIYESTGVILYSMDPGNEITFNKGTDKECVGEFVCEARIAGLIFKLVKGSKKCIESGVTLGKPFFVEIIDQYNN